jgi:AraC-like DNA-binding protein/DNA gyrase inhibitor GyrI
MVLREMTKQIQTYFHRIQVTKAIIFIKENLAKKISLSEIASHSGSSQYHFIRVFSAYTGETPFNFIARERIAKSLHLLLKFDQSITQTAHTLGFDSSSSFNKTFKKLTTLNPSEFRNLGKDQSDKLIYTLCMTPKTKELSVNIKMNLEPEIIQRKKTTILGANAIGGEFSDIAPIAWQNFLAAIETRMSELEECEFLGVGSMDKSDTKQVCSYSAAISIPENSKLTILGLRKEEIPASKYAKFILEGSHQNVWFAFEKAFKVIVNGSFELEQAPCLENYLNDPSTTKDEELRTEILIPIK